MPSLTFPAASFPRLNGLPPGAPGGGDCVTGGGVVEVGSVGGCTGGGVGVVGSVVVGAVGIGSVVPAGGGCVTGGGVTGGVCVTGGGVVGVVPSWVAEAGFLGAGGSVGSVGTPELPGVGGVDVGVGALTGWGTGVLSCVTGVPP